MAMIPSPVYGVLPPDIPKEPLARYLQNAIIEASKQAKLVFDANQWCWNDQVPSLGQIVDLYTKLVHNVMEWPEIGNSRCGGLVVEYTDGIWEFSVEVAFISDEP